ncbi:hypothetical protein [Spirosoma foliorum]|uniref:YD repeat-containing protein n=1 Tax=Spirosoma foliorum TaxID=2710596 RepID=A0A7G5H5Z7_9BACT|nr:hypothetical protein [Spirosoma foliorum]QMW06539.1 hypothetical protein H3H32_17400 [Spirosoma foliorum]
MYNYDDSGRLMSIIDNTVIPTVTSYAFGRTTMEYDSQGRLSQIENLIEPTNNNPVLTFYYRTTYDYDANSNIVAIKKYKVFKSDPAHPFLQEDSKLTYGSTVFPVKIDTKINDGSQFDPELDFTQEYTYSAGNVVEVKRTDRPTHYNGYNTYTTSQVLQYDDKPNPFYGLIIGSPDVSTFSKNNVIESTRLYTYDTNGLLSKIALRDGTSETTYEYESY